MNAARWFQRREEDKEKAEILKAAKSRVATTSLYAESQSSPSHAPSCSARRMNGISMQRRAKPARWRRMTVQHFRIVIQIHFENGALPRGTFHA
jgi:hypothetical protein